MSAVPDLILHSSRAEEAGSVEHRESDFARELVLHQPRLARLVQRLLGWPAHNHEVDDIVQEVMVSAWTHRATFRGDGALGTWVATIAINQVRRHRRRLRLFRRLFRRHADLSAIPDVAEEMDERQRALRQAVSQLHHRDREILVLHYLEGHRVEAIAGLLGLNRNAAHARMSRARKRLRRIVDQERDDD